MTQENITFTHKLYPTELCVLLPNSKFIPRKEWFSICWRYKSSQKIHDSSCKDAGFYPEYKILKQLGY